MCVVGVKWKANIPDGIMLVMKGFFMQPAHDELQHEAQKKKKHTQQKTSLTWEFWVTPIYINV